jgi:lipoprotein-anchoring transpeptidase ErfK/SrfK
MRCVFRLVIAIFAIAVSADLAFAGVLVQIDKSAQRMSVAVDGQIAYVWPVSTGRVGHGTPVGRFRPHWLARSWFSTRYYGSPMPHAIFFHKGYAIHGTNYISRLGGPASHGCVRLHPRNAAALFALVQHVGMGNTSIVVTGGNVGSRGIPRRRIG